MAITRFLFCHNPSNGLDSKVRPASESEGTSPAPCASMITEPTIDAILLEQCYLLSADSDSGARHSFTTLAYNGTPIFPPGCDGHRESGILPLQHVSPISCRF